MDTIALRQILYRSQAVGQPNVSEILAASKRNNGLDGITGLLLYDGNVFLQVLEGPENSVAAAFGRIRADRRHEEIEVISDGTIGEREFGYWSMELRNDVEPSDDAMWRLRRRLEQFRPDLYHHFFASFDQK